MVLIFITQIMVFLMVFCALVVNGPLDAVCEGVCSFSAGDLILVEEVKPSVSSWDPWCDIGVSMVVIALLLYLDDSYLSSSAGDTGIDYQSFDMSDRADLVGSFLQFVAENESSDLAFDFITFVAEHAHEFV